ncbi:MAG: mechanosensitive ion channel [Actinobacteria bacterium]|nr:mechanosensitive ion channel [Actinomycetota bacterium]
MPDVNLWIALGIACGSVLAWVLVQTIWRGIWSRVRGKRPGQLIPEVMAKTSRSLAFVVLMAGLRWAVWTVQQIQDYAQSGWLRMAQNVLFAGLVIGSCLLAAQFLGGFFQWYRLTIAQRTKTTLDDEFIPLFSKLSKIVIFFVGAMIILQKFQVNITGFIATAGVASLAVALAAKDTLANMISGFLIMVDRPFRINDRIELPDGKIGDVQEIGLRCTKILTYDNTLLVVPNSDISAARVVNHGYPNANVKLRLKIGVAYGTDMERVKDILVDIARRNPRVMDDPAPAAYFMAFGDSSLDAMLIAWVADYRDRFSITDEINLVIQKRFSEAGIEIPFPQRDVHLYQKS